MFNLWYILTGIVNLVHKIFESLEVGPPGYFLTRALSAQAIRPYDINATQVSIFFKIPS